MNPVTVKNRDFSKVHRYFLFVLLSLSGGNAQASNCQLPTAEDSRYFSAESDKVRPIALPNKACQWMNEPSFSVREPRFAKEKKDVPLEVVDQSANVRRYPFHYDIYRAHSPNPQHQTVIFLGGGPGIAWIPLGRPSSVPADYDVIVVDYPGTGVNDFPNADPDRTYLSNFSAKAIEQVIKSNKLDNYVIYGHSYGSSVATVLASSLAKSAHPPRAVLLEGTSARTFVSGPDGLHELGKGYTSVSDQALDLLTSEQAAQVKASLSAIVQLGAERALAQFFSAFLGNGAQPVANLLKAMIQQKPEKIVGCLRAWFQLDSLPIAFHTMPYSSCEQVDVSKKIKPTPVFRGAFEIKMPHDQLCGCSGSQWKGTFDSAKFAIDNTALFVLNGSSDANTPLDRAQYLFDHQKNPNKSLSVIVGGGHATLLRSPGACNINLWKTVFAGVAKEIRPQMACLLPAPPTEAQSTK